jgi:Capsule assembly protein Wzi/PAP2 superfamily
VILVFQCSIATLTMVPQMFACPQQDQRWSGSTVRSAALPNDSAPDAGGNVLREPREGAARSFKGLAKDFVGDQKDIWTSPRKIRFEDADWLVPLAGLTAGLFVTDRQVSGHLAADKKTQQHYRTIATDGAFALVGVGGGMALWSKFSHNNHQRETGFLSGEAAIDSFVVTESLKYLFQRQRPYEGNGAGHFFHGGTSFPSEHAAAAWSIAGIIAHEYPGRLPKFLAYGLATAVSLSRIKSRDHFPSDVLVGSGIGWLISQEVYRKHHDPELGGDEWLSVGQWMRDHRNSPGYLGSPYVPLDSWIYPALDRLAAMGWIDSGFAGMRPWTRLECQRLLGEASEKLAGSEEDSAEASRLIEALQREFRADAEEAAGDGRGTFRLESLYSRTENISGKPLTDGFHFGQTLINDFGRPYGEGWNTVTGFSSYATNGPWVAYVRGEWQTAPSIPVLPVSARQLILTADFPTTLQQLPPAVGQASTNRFELLDAYVGLTVSNWEFSFGRQSLWWGPGDSGPLTWSDNVAPLNMFRINRVTPLKLPWIFGWLGPLRFEMFVGQLQGQHFENVDNGATFLGNYLTPLRPQPFVHGEKINFKPTRNFEFGLARTDLFGGPSTPFTLGEFRRALFSVSNNDILGSRTDPGDQQSELDWSYRLPKLRDWLTFYGDAFADDQISPIAYLDRSAIHAGLYLSHVPRIPKLDIRAEGVYTDLPAGGALSHGFFYKSTLLFNGYTSNGRILGSWIGREGQGAQAWTNYWFNARNRLQLNFRHQKVSQQYLPGGGTLTDIGARGDYWTRFNVGISASVQYERWLFPVIQPNAARNVTAAVQISFEPQKWFRRTGSLGVDAEGSQGDRP